MMDELLEEMIDPAPSRQDVARHRRAWATGSILVLAAVGVTSLTTSALFTDQDTLPGALRTGTLVLAAEGASFEMPVGGLAPGGTVVAPVTVRNTGSLELRYAVGLSAVGGEGEAADLTTQLRTRILQDATCTLTSVEDAPVLGDSQKLVDQEFGLPRTVTPIVGSPETGAQTGDRVLAAVTGAETLCVRVDMARDAGNQYQSTTAALTLQVDSEQTVDN